MYVHSHTPYVHAYVCGRLRLSIFLSLQIRPTQQCLLRIFKLLDSLKDQLKQLREKGELSAVDMGSIEKTKVRMCTVELLLRDHP